ncbi:MAG: bifunctional metallophosphatase/5'-nucleotidase [Actinobacteria bacterium]|nr:bifunctional metallophosphatase/5'-nucleotidase [Actinomycetota bacterium]
MLIYECWPNRHESLASRLPRRCEYPPVITHKPSTSAQGNSLRVRLSAITSSLALVISALVVLTSPQASANTYAVPAAPTITKAYVTDAGIRVRFNPVSASPAVTHYVVTGGQGSCPVVVPATTSGSVRLPILEGQTSATVNVQAVNAYGFSPAAKWSKTFTATDLAGVAKTSAKNVQLLALSDFHGALEGSSTNAGTALLTSAFANERKAVASTITLSSGDNIGAAPAISSQFEELPTIESMNLMKFDVSTFGNHEHDRNIAHVQKVIGASDFAWVASNYSSLEPLKSGTKAAKSYVIIDRGGVKVGVVGMNTDETPEVIFPGNLDYTDASGAKKTLQISASVAGVNQAIKDAKSAGADIVVALLHYGWSENADGLAKGQLLDLAKGIKGAAAVLGGHSHQRYSSIMGTSARYGSTLIAQTPNAGVGYNRIQLCVSGSRVQGASLDYVTTADLKGVTADTAGAELVKKYKDQLVTKLDVKIGQVSELFPRGGTPAVERAGETPMGNYLADLMRKELKTDFALTNGGGLRDTFPAATYKAVDTTYKRPAAGVTGPFDVTLGDAISVLPFGNSVAVATISGTQLWAALENGVSQHPSGGRFPQISGFKFSFDTSKAVGSRITAVTRLDGTAIAKDAKTYTVATNDFMLYGGDGYTMLNPSTAKFPGKLLLDILVDGIKADLAAKRVTQTPKADGRITKVG